MRHLVTVWNPAYADAMDATIELLLECAKRHHAGELDEDEVFVWWGKVKSSNRQQTLVHLKDILAIDEDLRSEEGASREVHLYITDCREPPHVHVERDRSTSKWWLERVQLSRNNGFASAELARIREAILKHRARIMEEWHEHCRRSRWSTDSLR